MTRLLFCLILLTGWFPWRGMQPTRSQSRPAVAAAASYKWFEFAPSDGTGIGTACTCADVTGAAGETISSTRSTAAFCSTLGTATTGITNGSLISCATDKPRIEPDGNGVLGLRVEDALTNRVLRSQELDNGSWLKWHDGSVTPGADPTITANAAVAPDGTTTAEQIDYPATGASGRSIVYQLNTDLYQNKIASIYIKGVSGSGDTDLTLVGESTYSANCTFNSTTWTRCYVIGDAASSGQLEIGPNSVRTGRTHAAVSVYVWGVQLERGYSVSSYAASTGTNGTRGADSVYATLTNGQQPKCIGASFALPNKLDSTSSATQMFWKMRTDANNYYSAATSTGGNITTDTVKHEIDVSSSVQFLTSTATISADATTRVIAYIGSATQLGVTVGATDKTGTVTSFTALTTSSTKLYLGSDSAAGHEINGIVSKVKVGLLSTDCQ